MSDVVGLELGSEHSSAREERPRTLEAEAWLAAIVESSDDAIASWSLGGVLTSWNSGAERLLGYTAEEMIGQSYARVRNDFLPTDQPDEATAILERVALGGPGGQVEVQRTHRDGRTACHFLITISPVRNSSGTLVGMSSVSRDITAHKRNAVTMASQADELLQVNKELALSERHMRQAQRVAGVGSWYQNAETGTMVWSDEMRSILGVSMLAVPTRELFLSLVVPEDRKWVRESIDKVTNTNRITISDARGTAASGRDNVLVTRQVSLLRSDGQRRAVTLTRQADLGPNGEMLGDHGTIRDVTDECALLGRLHDSEERAHQLLKAIPDAVVVIDTDGRITDVNESATALFAYPAEELIGRPVEMLVPPTLHEAHRRNRSQYAAGNGPHLMSTGSGVVAVRKDGTTTPVEVNLGAIELRSGRSVLASVRDVSASRVLQEQLAQATDLYRGVLNAASEQSIIATDLEGRITVFNTGAQRMLGYSRAQMIGETPNRLHDPDEVQVRAIELGIAPGFEVFATLARQGEGSGHTQEWTYITSAGVRLSVALSLNTITGGDGVIAGYIGIATDITARREIERALQESEQRFRDEQVRAREILEAARDVALEASRQKSSFLATMSHEIRTPMNAIIGMSGLLLDTILDAEQREFADTVRTGGDALLGIINNILDFSKIEGGGLELEQAPFDLRECVEDALDLVAATNDKGIELLGQLDRNSPYLVVGDVTRFRQVLVNLIGNAVKFTHQGEVVVTVADEQGSDGTTALRISVADTGIGIPADRLASLFVSFSQVDTSTTRLYGGTGLGLAISQRLVDAMGGELSVESTVGIGTTFSFSIVLGIVPINANIGAPANTVPLDGRSALVVDDNATNRRILRRQLEGWGMTVTEAETGEVAVALVMGGAAFDVALVDMKMPEMSGTELEEILASMPATRTLPVILLSSRGERRATSRPGVAREVLTKPVRQGYLHDVVQHALRSVDQPSLARSGGKAQPTSDVAPMRVLVAEDNPVNQRVGRLMLEKLGHHVDVVGNGREAFDAIRAAPYDVILMDLEMPDMDGLDATRAIRRELPADRQPRIVGLTASVLVEIRRDCIEAGMDDYLSKPVRLEELATVLQ